MAFQAEVALLLSRNRTPDNYLASGAALHIEPNSKRFSNDLDYFQDSVARVATAFDEDRAILASAGCAVDVSLERPGFVRESCDGRATRDFRDRLVRRLGDGAAHTGG